MVRQAQKLAEGFRVALARSSCLAALPMIFFVVCQIGPASAGEFQKIGPTGGVYSFLQCGEPPAYSLSEADLKRIKRSPRAKRRAVNDYNAYTRRLNDYFQCLRIEADKDIQTYFGAVTAAYEARQTGAIDRAEEIRRALSLPEPAFGPVGVEDERLEGELLGGSKE